MTRVKGVPSWYTGDTSNFVYQNKLDDRQAYDNNINDFLNYVKQVDNYKQQQQNNNFDSSSIANKMINTPISVNITAKPWSQQKIQQQYNSQGGPMSQNQLQTLLQKANSDANNTNNVSNNQSSVKNNIQESSNGFWDRVQNSGINVPQSVRTGSWVNNILNSAPLKFINQMGAAADRAIFGDNTIQSPSTGNKIADTAANIVGTGIGFSMNPERVGGAAGVPSLASGADQFIGKPIENMILKATGKDTATELPKLGQYGLNALQQGANFGALNAGQTALQGGNAKQIAQSGAEGLGQGAIFGTATKGLGDLGGFILKKISPADVKANTEVPTENMQTAPVTNLETQTAATKFKPGTYTVKNTQLENAINDYNDAIETIHNHFQQNKLTPDEVARIKPELGIDLDELISNIEKYQNKPDIRQIANAGNMRSVVGLNKLPNKLTPFGTGIENEDAAALESPLKENITKNVTNNNSYVDTNPLKINIGKNDKTTSTDIRQAYSGKLNGQIVTGVQLKNTMQKLAPKEQEAIQLWLDVGGDKAKLQEMVNNSDEVLDGYIPNSNKVTYREAYQQAQSLSPQAQKAANMAQQYYQEAGNYSMGLGTTNSVLDNYANRMWKQEPEGTIKTETGKSGLGTYTSHKLERTYDTIGEGLLNGKEPATLNAGDLLTIHNQEMARVNSNMELANAMRKSGIGQYVNGKPSAGFTAIDSLSQKIPTDNGTLVRSYQVPDGIANGIRAITDPNYLKIWGRLNGIQKYQGVVKTIDLSYSLFHHVTMMTQALYNNGGGIDFVRHLNDLTKLDSPEFNAMEKDFVQHTGMTNRVQGNLDVLNKLSGNNTLLDKMTNIPVLKQIKQFSDANTNLLFDKIQTWLKVTDYNMKVLDYVAKHPETDNVTLDGAKRSIAKEVNNAYGGLNWTALGKDKTTLGVERLGLLAPDWTESSVRMVGNAFEKSAGGTAARKQYLIGLGGAILLTEGLNHILTGHFTDQNPKGHELEVEVQPGVYVSAFKSGIGDLTKLTSNIVESGVGGGVSRSLQAKLSPLARLIPGLLLNKDYNGGQIYGQKNKSNLQNDINVGKYIAQEALPLPFGVSNAQRYNQSGNANTLGNVIVDSGIGRYSQDKTQTGSVFDNPSSSYQDNWIHKFINRANGDKTQQLLDQLSQMKKQKESNDNALNEDLGNYLSKMKDEGGNGNINTDSKLEAIFDKYKVPDNKRRGILTKAKNKLKSSSNSSFLNQYNSLNYDDKVTFYNSLASDLQKMLPYPKK